MGRALMMDRVRADVDVLARAGLDVPTFLAEVDGTLRRAVPYGALCVSLHDPATSMPTATFKLGGIAECESHDLHWCEVEFRRDDPTTFRDLAARDQLAVGMHLATGGDVASSVRMREFMTHHFGFTDELRSVARVDGQDWGALAMMRSDPGSAFEEADVAFVASLSSALARGMRAGVLAQCGRRPERADEVGTGVLVVRQDDRIAQRNEAADHWLAALGTCDNSDGPVLMLAALVDSARRYARGEAAGSPRSRVRLPDGRWLVLGCSPLAGQDGAGTDVVITIEEARPPEIVPLVVAAFELTPRERDVAWLVLHGIPSREIGKRLHISTHTVQDHLKAIFAKAGVRSRRELVARVFFDQYLPRMGGEVTPAGWFADPAGNDESVVHAKECMAQG